MARSTRSSNSAAAQYRGNPPAAYAMSHGPRHSAPGPLVQKRHHPVAWIVLILLVLLIAAGGFFGFKLYKEAKQVQIHEQNALTILKSFKGIKSTDDLATVSNQIPSLQKETATAEEIAHGNLWTAASKIPWAGSDISTVQGMTEVVNDLSQNAIPSYLKTIEALTSADLSTTDGSLNLRPLIAAQKTLPNADKLIQASYKKYVSLSTPQIGLIKDAYLKGEKQLKEVSETSQSLLGTINIIPAFLGSDGSKTYVIASVTPAEARSSGGLVGSLGSMTANNGKISMGTFYPNKNFQHLGYVNKSSGTGQIFRTPLHFSFDIRDQDAIPDFATAAEGISTIWQRSGYTNGTPDGVLQIDPVFLQEVNKISGSITLNNGTKLTGTNTAEYLENTIYKEVPVSQQDLIFGEVAARSVNNLFTGMNFKKMTALSKILPNLGKSRHFQMTSNDSVTQKYLDENGYTPKPQSSESSPTVGIYTNQNNASKMDWYIARTAAVSRSSCNSDGSQTYHVKYTLKNKLTSISGLSSYIVGTGNKGITVGSASERMLFYAPAGGSISNFKITGTGSTPEKATLNGSNLFHSLASVSMGQSVAYDFDVTTSSKATKDLILDQTPTTTTDTGITYTTGICEIKK